MGYDTCKFILSTSNKIEGDVTAFMAHNNLEALNPVVLGQLQLYLERQVDF